MPTMIVVGRLIGDDEDVISWYKVPDESDESVASAWQRFVEDLRHDAEFVHPTFEPLLTYMVFVTDEAPALVRARV